MGEEARGEGTQSRQGHDRYVPPTHPDFQDLAERSYQRQIRQLKPDHIAYAQQKHAETHAEAPRPTGERQIMRASEAVVPPAVASYGTHAPDEDAVDRLVSHLNHEYVTHTYAGTTRSSAAAGAARTTWTSRARISTSATSASTARSSVYVRLLTQYFGEHTKELRENCTYPLLTPSGTWHRVRRRG